MQIAKFFKRLFTQYGVDIILAIVFTVIAFAYVYDQSALLSAIARKVALASVAWSITTSQELSR